ncbi:Bpu10I family restriction endonuclease [Streptomyces alfalfae]|uniref:Bpu10I family restriction endonuclease n=1 Tax=Streptomyces alfalfae TaxID=1642299 RepID=A0A4Q7ETI2_9ACTN|nr:Bpu10I family restriction endonuclease [Streptomyces alfalfae]AYA16738.1 Bpu10I family restriction endonuclease [Streptomyces fradiae]QQC91382.1 Bpu10I family restriction endonuclease [Streptomyces alfalfae]RXX41600.1 Bpu10I family restriction endonuclease [Streptomyces alfalfae]RZM91007.1 Bpu10I family restriction endonuclease [Streptomyces alfalfae]
MNSDEALFTSLEPPGAAPAKPVEAEPLADASAEAPARVRPTPHKSKLVELLKNSKLPEGDRISVKEAIERYKSWIGDMASVDATGDELVRHLVDLTNDYKKSVELDLIWDSERDFLFRQRGQLKIDNSIIEEFLPWLIDPRVIPVLAEQDLYAGPAGAFAAAYFSSSLTAPASGISMKVRRKDQDFTLSRRAYVKASFKPDFPAGATSSMDVWLAYVAAECKTNLDKTMFQEASATSHDLKVAVPAARYYLICEYLDMTPISTAGTDIDEVLILRGKRLGSHKRKEYSSAANRKRLRSEYVDYIEANPIRYDVVQRFVDHLRSLFEAKDPNEEDVVVKGYF